MEDVAEKEDVETDLSFAAFEAEVAQRKHVAKTEHVISEHPRLNSTLQMLEYQRNPFRTERSKFIRRFLDMVVDAMRMKGMSIKQLAANMQKPLHLVEAIMRGEVENLELDDMIKILLCVKRRFRVAHEELTPSERRAVEEWNNPNENHF